MNPLYNGNNDFMTRFNQYRQNFRGNPEQILQQAISQGRVSQTQVNQALNQARQIAQFIR